ncbi:hypothetical protein BJX96DRAFT_58744 [Aspergillus floccosus]
MQHHRVEDHSSAVAERSQPFIPQVFLFPLPSPLGFSDCLFRAFRHSPPSLPPIRPTSRSFDSGSGAATSSSFIIGHAPSHAKAPRPSNTRFQLHRRVVMLTMRIAGPEVAYGVD